MLERAAQVRHREALVDRDALELVEHRGVRRVELVGAVHLAGRDRRRSAARASSSERICTGLVWVRITRWRSTGSTKNVSCIGARRVILVEVERVEVEPLVLELGAFRDLPAHADEDVADLLLQEGERMPRAGASARGDAR